MIEWKFYSQNKGNFEIVFFNHYLHSMAEAAVSRCTPRVAKNPGGALWLRRAANPACDLPT